MCRVDCSFMYLNVTKCYSIASFIIEAVEQKCAIKSFKYFLSI